MERSEGGREGAKQAHLRDLIAVEELCDALPVLDEPSQMHPADEPDVAIDVQEDILRDDGLHRSREGRRERGREKRKEREND
jgi:hypothetical protein